MLGKLFSPRTDLFQAKSELEEVVEFLRDPKRFTNLGGKLPKVRSP